MFPWEYIPVVGLIKYGLAHYAAASAHGACYELAMAALKHGQWASCSSEFAATWEPFHKAMVGAMSTIIFFVAVPPLYVACTRKGRESQLWKLCDGTSGGSHEREGYPTR